jgi:hypothetical protein
MVIHIVWNGLKNKYEAITDTIVWGPGHNTMAWGEGDTPSQALKALATEHEDILDDQVVTVRVKERSNG